ncbi:ATP-binding protein [Actinomadura madurae]|uniref:ATP-binding protein n=1 Tax=Actinomadura madurae TaxID=1993 RepID=UPI0020D23CAF|nr:hypothetical protein [Actinomadura madurae]MCQ0014746.1 hypothetical protein [Actinomadura madurae]
MDDIGYSQEITDNVRGFIRVRLSSLRLGTTGRFFEGGHPIDFDALLSRNVVLEIEDVGDDRDKAFLMGTVLVRLVEHLRLRQRRDASTGLRHLSVFEEAHRLLRRTEQAGAAAHAVETFASLLAEIRAYGEGLIVAEQIPSKLVPDVIKNTAVKIVHRLPAKDDRDAVGATMNITEAQSQFLVTLTPGEGAVFTDGMDFPHLVRMPDGSHLEKAVPTASPSVLVTPRSGTCGADCRDSPCTLRDMRAAQRAVADRPELVVWAELAAAAHLTGWGTPRPDPSLLDGLPGAAARLHRVPRRRRGRRVPRRPHRVGEPPRGRLARQRVLDRRDVLLRAPYRWCLVVEELERASRETPGGGRHPSSGEWEDLYERAIPGDTLAEQLRTVNAWWERDQRDEDARNLALWGSGKTLETAVGALRTDPEWPDRFREATSALRNFGGLLGSYVTE